MAPKAPPLPAFFAPQLAALAEKVPDGPGWIHEVKFDGYRALGFLESGRARLLTRKGNDWTDRFSPLAEALARLPAASAIVDGEIVALDERGASSFHAMQEALSARDPSRLVYYLFDLLHLNGKDLRPLPLVERKRRLAELLREAAGGKLRYSDHVEGRGTQVYRQACRLRLEGIVSKSKGLPYVSGRSSRWLKVKCIQRQEFLIGGYTEPRGARSTFGSLLLGLRRDGGIEYCGKVGTGFTEGMLRDLGRKLSAIRSATCPFSRPPEGTGATKAHWVRPELVAEIDFAEWTRDRRLRQARFQGLREDKGPEEIVLERPEPIIAGIRLSHPERVLYPEQGITKRALADYYARAAERMLPHVARRPLALLRCPEGHRRDCFFQKHAQEAFPPSIGRIEIDEKGEARTYIYIKDLAGLIYLAQLGALELHPWGCRIKQVDKPDLMTFDLDPAPGVAWSMVVEAAFALRDKLKGFRLESFPKSTGSKGLHIVVPLRPKDGWERVKAFSKAVAESLALEKPDRYTARLGKAQRRGKIFIDYLRNNRGATAVAAYSTRAKNGAPIATPLSWKELAELPGPDFYTIDNIEPRLRGIDPWRRFQNLRQSLPEF